MIDDHITVATVPPVDVIFGAPTADVKEWDFSNAGVKALCFMKKSPKLKKIETQIMILTLTRNINKSSFI